MNPSNSNRKKKQWREEKERLLKMTLQERRKTYIRDAVPLKDILTWMEEMQSKNQGDAKSEASKKSLRKLTEEDSVELEPVRRRLSEKVSLYRGDITLLEIDAIVNAANSSLLGGGGVDGCIHRAAGSCLLAECRSLSGCETGEAKITCGYDLPAKYVIHTVGPIARGNINETHKDDLANCYRSSLKRAKEHNIRSIAFPCISTGIYGFPNEPAAKIALDTITEWLLENHSEMDRVIFCVFLEIDFKIYTKKLAESFPLDDDEGDTSDETAPMEQKAQSPPSKKCKGKKPEDSRTDSVGDSTDEKEVAEEQESINEKELQEKEGKVKESKEEKDGTEMDSTVKESIEEKVIMEKDCREKDGTEKESSEEQNSTRKESSEEKESREEDSSEEVEGQSLETVPSIHPLFSCLLDEEKTLCTISPTEDAVDSCQDKEHSKDSKELQEDSGDQSMDAQEQAEGFQDDEMNSQLSDMEIEGLSSKNGDKAENDQLSQANGKEGEDSAGEKEKTCSKVIASEEYDDINLNNDAEMNSQLENAVVPTERQPQEQLIGEHDEKKEQ